MALHTIKVLCNPPDGFDARHRAGKRWPRGESEAEVNDRELRQLQSDKHFGVLVAKSEGEPDPEPAAAGPVDVVADLREKLAQRDAELAGLKASQARIEDLLERVLSGEGKRGKHGKE
jgi:hypothetical protein